jgi:hypothetical protein
MHEASTDLSGAVDRGTGLSNRRQTSIGVRMGFGMVLTAIPPIDPSTRIDAPTPIDLSVPTPVPIVHACRVGVGAWLAAVVAADWLTIFW